MSTDSERDQSTDRLLRKAALRRLDAAESEACLDAEAFAAWAEGALPDADATRVEAHLADCARCQSMMASFAGSESAAATPAAAAPTVIPFKPRSIVKTLRWLMPVAAGTAAASLLIWTAWPKPDASVGPASQTMAMADAPAPAAAPQAQGEQAGQMPRAKSEASPAELKLAGEARTADKRSGTLQPASRVAKEAAVKPVPTPMPAAPPPAPTSIPPPAAPPPPPPAQVQAGAVRTEPPTVSQTVGADSFQTLPRADRHALNFLILLPGTVEFGPTDSLRALDRTGSAVGGMGRGGGAGAGGRSATAATAATAAERAIPPANVRWRILSTGEVGKTTDAGVTWQAITIEPAVPVTQGAAPSATVCWLIGRGGVVLLSSDGLKFTRLKFPEAVDLQSIAAVNGRQATVTTVDGRTFTTTDAGQTWK